MTEHQPEAPALPGVTRWRKKAVIVEAIQLTHESGPRVWEWADSKPTYGTDGFVDGLAIYTLEGRMRANFGDWIIKGVKGEFYPCRSDVFEATYEPAESPLAGSVPDDTGRGLPAQHGQARERAGAVPGTTAGIALLAAERARQVAVEGYTPEHDAGLIDRELTYAAVAYATAAVGADLENAAQWWPWDRSGFKPGPGPLDSLTKAGALVAAELDRLIAKERAVGETQTQERSDETGPDHG